MVVISTVEQWFSLKAQLQGSSDDKHLKLTFRSLGPNQVCDITVDSRSISLRYSDLKHDMTEDGLSQAMDSCIKTCTGGITTFLLLLQGGHYTKRERRLIEILQAHFGAQALKYLVVLSLEDGEVADTMEEDLLDLINMCDGRYCRITGNKLHALFEMVDYMLTENGVTGYTETMLTEAKKRSTEDSAMKILKQKVQEAEEKEEAFRQLVKQQEERRAKEMELLRKKHAEERQKEAAEQQQYETKRKSLEEAVISHRAMLQLQMSATEGKTHL